MHETNTQGHTENDYGGGARIQVPQMLPPPSEIKHLSIICLLNSSVFFIGWRGAAIAFSNSHAMNLEFSVINIRM